MSIITSAAETPDKPAYIAAETGQALSFRALNEQSIRLARVLRRELDEGDRFGLLLENGPAYFIAAWAGRRSALRFVPINWHLKAEEGAYIAENSDSRALIASPRLADLANAIADRNPALKLLISDSGAFGRFVPLADVLAPEPATPLGPEKEGVYMFYSSGTTGQPKGILRRLPDLPFGSAVGIENLQQSQYGFGPDTVFFSPAPLYHAAPLGWTMGAQTLGGTVVVPSKFEAEQTLAQIEKYRVTHCQFVPTHFVRMLQLPEEVRRRYDLSSLRVVIHSAAPCPIDVKERMIAWLGPIVYEYYGLSEGGGFTAISPQEWLTHKGSVGRSLSTKIHIIDDDGAELPNGQTGHIQFESADRFEYHKEPEKTAAFFTEKGWSRPGDMGWIDDEGFLYLADRASHMIISGGVNIYPQEAEALLITHPAIRDVAVIGVPDPEFGEAVKAVVELKPEVSASPALGEELMAFCRESLAGFKCPKTVDFIEELPRLPTGKLLKRELRARYWGDRKSVIV